MTLLVAPAPARAESPEAAAEAAVTRLEREVAALREAVAALAARTPSPSTPPPPSSAVPADLTVELAELSRRIDALAGDLEALRFGEAAPRAEESRHGLGPAASKVYAVADGLSIGGYGEMIYQGVSSRRDDDRPSGRLDELDFLRAVVYVGYKWNEIWLFNSEIEFEHAKAGEGQRGEVAAEFAYLERRIRPEVNLRAGLMLVPMGITNELHEPTVFLGARRPGIEQAILPTTWRENGVGLFGDVGPFTYRTYLMNGLEARRFAAGGLRSSRQNGAKAIAEDLAWVGRLDWTAVPGLVAGAAVYVGDSGQELADVAGPIDVGTRIVDLHASWRARGFDLSGVWVAAELDEVARLNALLGLSGAQSVGERLEGFYLQVGYDVAPHVRLDRQTLAPYMRFEAYDTQAEVPSGYARGPANRIESLTLGLAWKPIEQIVFKADWQDLDNDAETGVDQFNLAFGYVF